MGLLDTAIFVLMNLLNGFRHLSAAELADVELVFGDSVDFDHVYIATDSPTNRIFFGIQDFFTGEPQSRAFTTGNLINFDAGDGPIERFTLVHEMTHVWQNQNVGPIYMAHAIADHVRLGDDASYNYGYLDSSASATITLPNALYDGSSKDVFDGPGIGVGAEAVVHGKPADRFMDFGPEMQGQMMMHYFTRKVLLGRPQNDYADVGEIRTVRANAPAGGMTVTRHVAARGACRTHVRPGRTGRGVAGGGRPCCLYTLRGRHAGRPGARARTGQSGWRLAGRVRASSACHAYCPRRLSSIAPDAGCPLPGCLRFRRRPAAGLRPRRHGFTGVVGGARRSRFSGNGIRVICAWPSASPPCSSTVSQPFAGPAT